MVVSENVCEKYGYYQYAFTHELHTKAISFQGGKLVHITTIKKETLLSHRYGYGIIKIQSEFHFI